MLGIEHHHIADTEVGGLVDGCGDSFKGYNTGSGHTGCDVKVGDDAPSILLCGCCCAPSVSKATMSCWHINTLDAGLGQELLALHEGQHREKVAASEDGSTVDGAEETQDGWPLVALIESVMDTNDIEM